MLDEVVRALRGRPFMFGDEAELQRGVGRALTTAQIPWRAECVLSPKDRIDFMVGNIGIECKIDHGRASLLRQLFRYAQQDQVAALVVVLGRFNLSSLPSEINGKPLVIVHAARAFA